MGPQAVFGGRRRRDSKRDAADHIHAFFSIRSVADIPLRSTRHRSLSGDADAGHMAQSQGRKGANPSSCQIVNLLEAGPGGSE